MSESPTPTQLNAIYDAAFSRDRWSAALDAFADGSNARGLLLYEVGDRRAIQYTAQAVNSGYDWIGKVLPEYNLMMTEGRGSGLDREGSALMHAKPAFHAVRDEELWEIDDEFKSRPEIAFTIDRLGSYRRFFINLSEDPLSYSALIVHYSNNWEGSPPSEDMRRMEVLAPHLGKALEMNRAMHGLRQKYNAVLSVLDQIDVAISILDERGYAILTNTRARELFDERDGVWLDRSGRIMCRSHEETDELIDAIDRLNSTAQGANQDRSRDMEINRASSQLPVFAIVSPLRDADMEIEPGLTGAMVTFIEGMRSLEPNCSFLAQAYGLTQKECELAPLLVAGKTNSEISEEIGIGAETVKSHVAAILSKTRSKNRISFVWRVFQLSQPIL